MAFDLSSFLGRYTPVSTTSNAQAAGNVPNNIQSALTARALASLLPGQTVQGEIVSMQGSQVQVLLGNEFLLNASLENQADLNIGQLMSFQVKSVSQTLVSLVPLSVNLTMDENVMKALNESGLPVTDKTVEMVNTLMKEGMPIDKEALLNAYKEVMNFPKTDVETLVQMQRLKIPVTEANIEQFEAYKNYNHKLTQGVTEFQNQLQSLWQIAGRGAAQGLEGSTGFLKQVLAFFAENSKAVMQSEDGAVIKTTTEAGAEQAAAAGQAGTEETAALTGEEAKAAAKVLAEQTKADVTAGKGALEGEALKEVLNPAEKQNFLLLLREIGVKPETIQAYENGQLDVKQLAALLQEQELGGEKLSKLFLSKEFGKLLQNDISNQFLLQPEQVRKDEIEEYYSNLKDQTAKLLQLLENTGRGESAAAKTLQTMNKNVDFLNQLNQMYSYVQLPLKMANDTAHGDLYVYTNKKNLAKKDGNLSALLHLDMPHLGMLDVYVAMQAGRVSTNFYLQDEEMITFMEQHMELLTKRLQNKGYQTSAQVMLRKQEEEKSVMDEILKQEKNVPEMMKIGMRSFDVRA